MGLGLRKRCPHWVIPAALVLSLLPFCSAASLAAQVPTEEDHAARATQLVQAGDLKGAEAEMRQAAELSPQEPLYQARLGLILGMQHRPEEATACFENALKLDPSNLAIRRNLASSQWQLVASPPPRKISSSS